MKRALAVFGMPLDFDLTDPDAKEDAHQVWKSKMVSAREANDDDLAKELSAAWNAVKSYNQRWCACGKKKSTKDSQCWECLNKQGKTRPPVDAGPVEYNVPCDRSRKSSLLMGQVKALDRVGASRTIHASDMGIRWAADKLDMQVFIQPVNGHKGNTKGWFRVWRTEGLPLNEVNKAIIHDAKEFCKETKPMS
jgi:hypothetical protein